MTVKMETRIGCYDTDKIDDGHEMEPCAFLLYTEAAIISRLVCVFSRRATKVFLGPPIHPDLTTAGFQSTTFGDRLLSANRCLVMETKPSRVFPTPVRRSRPLYFECFDFLLLSINPSDRLLGFPSHSPQL